MSDDKKDTKEILDPVGDRLIKARKVLICEEINQTMAKKVIGQLLALAEESSDDIQLFINSQGGHVEAGDSIHDIIQFIEPRVKVIGTGWVASAGTHIFLAADKEDRYCLPNTRFLIHQPTGGVGGQASDIAIQAEQILRMRERLARIISEATGQSIEQVRKDIERDRWMTTDEAIEYGIVSKVVRSSSEMV
ncbi:ATP-dependent Clp protease proteolytic subunit [Saccharospirillum sp. MSK14-1]|uniref:ATP-dependent Clp protease proteolytic subunit n=1 Tax=Saccharospirillum sp. MSK14-1 TaxID=1897632 RepID=UPI000D3A2889|nr:ATP-dependent Clp protease proteolytic subunit [Saccharospirillum sp. MSK14-1]PTY37522.1 ATP-dependent Clp protease proteolytic subunit [Saccharospirillum sp. MSK14-1]